MVDEPVSPEQMQTGQAAAPVEGTSPPAPADYAGQAQAPHGQDAGQAPPPQPTDEPSFFDPTSLSPELIPAYKMMQGRFTQGMQKVKGQERKIQAFDAFESNPHSQEIQQFMARYGYVPASQVQQMQQSQPQQPQQWEPQTWDEVMAKAEERAEQRIMERLQPVLGQVYQQTAKTIEQQLSTIDPKWRDYEDQMKENLARFPQMVNTPDLLYRISVPQEVMEAKAIREALDKFQGKAAHAAVGTKSSAPRSTPAKPKVSSFDDAVAAAKRELGIA